MSGPTLSPILPPPDRGFKAREYLGYLGLVDRIPCIRSSDVKYLDKPFVYYLARRLGVVQAFGGPDYFTDGNWGHIRANLNPEIWNDEPALTTAMEEAFRLRVAEMAAHAACLELGDQAFAKFVETERLSMKETWAWFEAARQVRHAPDFMGGIDSLSNDREWKFLAPELTIACNPQKIRDKAAHQAPISYKTRIVVRLDRLMFNKIKNELWIDDWKFISGPRRFRAQTCPIEYQTTTYLLVVQEVMPQLIKRFNLPENTTLGGLRHILIGKPSISFGMNDRPYRWVAEGKRSKITATATPRDGKWHIGCSAAIDYVPIAASEDLALMQIETLAQKKAEKQFAGEPSWDTYKNRVLNWYTGRGEYAHNQVDFSTDPPVLISYTRLAALDRDIIAEWVTLTDQIYDLAVKPNPRPSNYPRTEMGMRSPGSPKPSPYADFHLLPVNAWPDIMRRNLMVINPRDKEAWYQAQDGPLDD